MVQAGGGCWQEEFGACKVLEGWKVDRNPMEIPTARIVAPSEKGARPSARIGSTLAIVLAASLPFAAKAAVVAWGLLGYHWQSLYKVFQLLAPVAWRKQQGRSWLAALWPIDEPLPSAKTWAAAVAVAAALAGSAIVAIQFLAVRLGIDPAALRADLDAKFSLTPARAIAIVVYLFSINAALEELHFRAWLDREIARRWGEVAGVVVSACAFSAMHLFIFAGGISARPISLGLLAGALFIAGVSWSLIARRPGGIHAAWLSHGLTDASLLTWGLVWLGYL
jgi:membrane protease YdiL (CAAX protease family)